MMDLVYCEDSKLYHELSDKLKQKFADKVKLTDGSDDVHTYRWQVDLPDAEAKEYFKFMLTTGFAAASFAIQIIAQGGNGMTRWGKEIKEAIDEVEKEIGKEK